MTKEFKDILGDNYTVDFITHDISIYDVLYHVTTKDRLDDIKQNGLLISQPTNKSMSSTDMLFFSYPIHHTTQDLFRCYDDSVIIVLDVEKLLEDKIIFYDDFWSSKDRSSNNNHLCCDTNIPNEYIKKIVEL